MFSRHEVKRHPETGHFHLVGQLDADGPFELASDKAALSVGAAKLARTPSGGISYEIEVIATEPKPKPEKQAPKKKAAKKPTKKHVKPYAKKKHPPEPAPDDTKAHSTTVK
jgi:hypothetical protein